MKRRTQKQIAAARANGAKSRGPVTDAGKQKSSQNSLKHGLNSRIVVLHNEEKDAYAQLTAEYMDHYDPQTPVERDLVNDIVSARWRLNRAMAMQTALLDLEMDRQRDAVNAEFAKTDEPTRCALAFNKLAVEGRGFTQLDRHETRLRRTIERATARLEALQQARKEAEAEVCANEPGCEQTSSSQADVAHQSRLVVIGPEPQPAPARSPAAAPETDKAA